MKITFKSIKIEGFMSIGKAEIEIGNRNLVLVEGKNNSGTGLVSNGSGKSCIFEAIYWVLTGKTVRGSREVINRYYNGYTVVSLLLEVNDTEYVLSRYREHPDNGNNLLIYKDGKDISGSGIKKSEQILNNELPFLTEDLIGSVIVLGQGLPSRFTGYDPAGRKEILEALSGNLGIVEIMKDRFTAYRNKASKQLSDVNVSINRLESVIETRKKDIEDLKDKQGEKVDDTDSLKEKLFRLNNTKEELAKKILSLETSHDNISDAIYIQTGNKSNLEYAITTATNTLSKQKAHLDSISNKICPTCGQDVGDPSLFEKLQKEYDVEVEKHSSIKAKSESELSGVLADLELYQNKLFSLNTLISEKKNTFREVEYGIIGVGNLLAQSDDYSTTIAEYEQEVEEKDILLAKDIKEMNRLIKIDAVTSYILREIGRDFRGHLLKGVVDYLNIILKEFSLSFFGKNDLGLILEDNKLFIEYEGRSYESLSGGEKHRADLAMQFSLREMLMKDLGLSFNILVLDEIFDNLDEIGVENLIRFLSDNLGDIESVFVVTHHASLPIPFDNKIVATKGIDMVTSVEDQY